MTAPRRRWTAARHLAQARALVPRIVDSEPAVRGACGPCPAIVGLDVTATGMGVAVLAGAAGRPCCVIKLPMSAPAGAGMAAETAALTALRADPRVGDWQRFIPQPLASGALHGRPYRVDRALRGDTVLDRVTDPSRRRRFVEAAADAIHDLHARTSTSVRADGELVARWVDRPVGQLISRHGRAPRRAARLRALQGELHGALAGRTLSVAAVHGDYWLGNVLFSGDGPSGVVDWDASGLRELPVMDLLHLVLYTRRLVTGRDLGEIVREQLAGGGWSTHERRLLEARGGWGVEGSLDARPALLLYWLRHVAHHGGQEGPRRTLEQRVWEHRNLRPVLTALRA
jgi:aminoglycoside phosphotransferase (APT) family kinase protein